MVSPAKAGGGRPLSDVPKYKQPFEIETDVDVVQPAGSYSLIYTVGCLSASASVGEGEAAVDIISTAATGPARYRLPDPFPGFTQLILPLLNIPQEVKITVRTFIPENRAITKALVVVELRHDTLSNPSILRKLYAAASSAHCKKRQLEKRARETRPGGEERRPELELLPELERKVR